MPAALSAAEAAAPAASHAPHTVLVTGYAPAPKGTSMHTMHEHCGVVLEVDPDSNVVVDAEVTVVTGLAKSFLHDILVGANLTRSVEEVAAALRLRYRAPSCDALVRAFRAAAQRYHAKPAPTSAE